MEYLIPLQLQSLSYNLCFDLRPLLFLLCGPHSCNCSCCVLRPYNFSYYNFSCYDLIMHFISAFFIFVIISVVISIPQSLAVTFVLCYLCCVVLVLVTVLAVFLVLQFSSLFRSAPFRPVLLMLWSLSLQLNLLWSSSLQLQLL